MSDLTRLFPRATIEAAENGDLEPLLKRLRASDLTSDEAEWIERRLKGDPSAKVRRGAKVKDNRDRDLTVVIMDEWLRVRWGERSATNRRAILSKVSEWNLTASAIRRIIDATAKPDLLLKVWVRDWQRASMVYGPVTKNSAEIPELLRDALNSPD